MNVSVVIATHGHPDWGTLARERALPTAVGQGALEAFTFHDPEATLAGVRNRAARGASGDWLCFLDADDELAPGYVVAMAKAWAAYQGPGQDVATESGPRPTRHPPLVQCALLVPAVQNVMPTGARQKTQIPNLRRDGTAAPLQDINRAVIGTLVPRHLFLCVGGFREGYEPYEDWELWLRCEEEGAVLVHVPDAVYVAHVREESGHRTTDPARKRDLTALYRRIRAEHGYAS